MDLFSVFFEQIIVFAITLAIGFISFKVNFIDENVLKGISKLMMNVLIPLLILTVVSNSGTRTELLSVWPFFIAGLLMFLIHFVVSFISSLLLKFKQPEKNCHICMTSYTNTSMFGYPILMALFPDNAGFYIAAYAIVEIVMLWTVGVLLISYSKGESGLNIKKMFSPITVALFLGVLMIFFDIHPQETSIWSTLTGIGGTMKYLGVIFIGGDIAKRGFDTIFKNKKVFSTVPIRLIIMPIAVFFLLKNIPIFNKEMLLSITIYSMLPTMLTMTIIAQEYDAASDYASATTLLTTLGSIVTMPLVFYFIFEWIH